VAFDYFSEGAGDLVAAQGERRGDAFHDFIGPGSTLVFGAMGHFARHYGAAQSAFGAVVGGLDFRMFKEQKHSPVVVLPPDAFKEALVVGVLQLPVPQLVVELLPDGPAAFPALLKGAGRAR
jgi:hypothetical protein